MDRTDCGKFEIDVLTRTDVLTIKNERERQTEKKTSFHKKMIDDVWFTFIVRRYHNHHILYSCLTFTNHLWKRNCQFPNWLSGRCGQNNYFISKICFFLCFQLPEFLNPLSLRIAGCHNLLNCLARLWLQVITWKICDSTVLCALWLTIGERCTELGKEFISRKVI